jgi:hypothetical protein
VNHKCNEEENHFHYHIESRFFFWYTHHHPINHENFNNLHHHAPLDHEPFSVEELAKEIRYTEIPL